MLNESVIMITGAAGRIGTALTRGLITQGAKVILVDSNADALARLEVDIGLGHALAFAADISDTEEIDKCIVRAVSRYEKIDAAVHLAYPRSSGWGRKFENLEKDCLEQDLAMQLGGAILFSQRILEYFKTQGHGNLIQVSSIMGVKTPRFENYNGTQMSSPLEYSVIKAGIIAMTKYLSRYYKGNNIRVNCVSPGGVLDNQPFGFIEKYKAFCNDKGMLDASDLIGTFSFLLSEHSRFVTGQNIIVDDGWSL